MGNFKIAVATLNQTPIDWENNVSNIKMAIERAKVLDADLLLLPELCLTGYGCEDLFLSGWIYEKAMALLFDLLPLSHGLAFTIGLPVFYEGKRYNACALLKGGKLLGIVAKQFLANDGVHYEHRWFEPWKAGEVVKLNNAHGEFRFGDLVFEVEGLKVGLEICEDAWRKEQRPGYKLIERGVQVILNPSASHFSFGKTKKRESEVVLEACEKMNVVYAYANLLGNEAGRIIYDGELMIATPKQGLVAKNKRFGFQNVQLIVSTIDKDSLQSVESFENEDVYDKERELLGALTLGLFDYLRKSKSKGFVLSLSGGADSSICAVMVAEMVKRGVLALGFEGFVNKLGLGSECIEQEDLVEHLFTCVYQWSKNSSWDTFESAQALSNEIGAKFFSWRIDKEVASYTDNIEVSLQRKLKWETDDIALQNIQARARSPIVWMLANIKKALLLTTSNRSEGDVGYATMDGDTSGSIGPIAGLDKDYIRKWLQWAESELGYSSLKHVNQLAPSAELRPHEMTQTDENDLMPYHVLLEIEKLAIREWKSPVQVFETLKSKQLCEDALLKFYVKKFFRLWSINQWKRERLAPSFLLDDFNVDPRTWCRFPILSGGYVHELTELENY